MDSYSVLAAPELVISDPFFEARGPDNFFTKCTVYSANLLNPIVFSGRHNSKLLGFVTSQKLTFKKTDRGIHDV